MTSERLKQLGELYLARTGEELSLLRTQLQQARAGDPQASLAMQQLAHRISGSGAMLGFKAIGDCAGHIERILRADSSPSEAQWQDIAQQVQNIEIELAKKPTAIDATE